MQELTVKEIVEIVGGKLLNSTDEILSLTANDVCIDSRVVKEKDIFVPFVGEKVDAHKYIPSVMEHGNITFTEKDVDIIPVKAYIKVDSSMDALRKLGRYERSKYGKKIVGVTGSVGKTTTREMVSCALAGNEAVYQTPGNFNSQIGVPITLSKMNDAPSDVAVLEMGISDFGHMDILSELVEPDIAVVTMIGVAHIEFMKTQENIRTEKLKIASRMTNDGILLLNGDDALLADMRGKDIYNVYDNKVKVYYYGTSDWCDFKAKDICFKNAKNTYIYVHGDKQVEVELPTLGKHNVLNSLAGLAVNELLGLDVKKAAENFQNFSGLRQKVFVAEAGYTVIDDVYNASPDSMKASLNVLCDIIVKQDDDIKPRKIAVLGDMYELGENSALYHREVGEFVNKLPIDELITVGELSTDISGAVDSDMIKVSHYKTNEEATEYLKGILKKNDVVLLKASNGMHFKEIVEKIK